MFMVVYVIFYIDLFVHLARRRHVIFVICLLLLMCDLWYDSMIVISLSISSFNGLLGLLCLIGDR